MARNVPYFDVMSFSAYDKCYKLYLNRHANYILITMTKILVTGTSAGGIGEYIVRYLLKNTHAEVIGVARRAAEYGDRYTHIQGDITNAETLEKIKAAVGDKLEGAIFNAGVLGDLARIESSDVDGVKKVFEINYFAPILLTKALLPALRAAKGRAIYTSSLASDHVIQGWTAYSGSKAALNSFVGILGAEEPEIVALAIDPGVVDTPMQTSIREEQLHKLSKEDQKQFSEFKERGLLVNPEDSGKAFGNLVLGAKKEWSGKFLPWNDPDFNCLTLS